MKIPAFLVSQENASYEIKRPPGGIRTVTQKADATMRPSLKRGLQTKLYFNERNKKNDGKK